MDDTAFVTCIYDNLSRTSFGGRNCRGERYLQSLEVLNNMDVPIICYTSTNDFPKIDGFIKENSLKNINLKVKNLTEIPYHKRIQEIKSTNPDKFDDVFWRERCVEIMWGKIHMIQEVIKGGDFSNVYWIDAGLSHRDVISSPKYCSNSDMLKNITHRAWSLFNKRLVYKLEEFLGGQVLLIETTAPHNRPIPKKYNKNDYDSRNGAIGGLFGGRVDKLSRVCEKFYEKVEMLLNDNELSGEESILYAVFVDNKELFKTFQFDTWYHEGWSAEWNQGLNWYAPDKVNFSNFFDQILENDTIHDRILIVSMAQGDEYRRQSLELIKTFHEFCNDADLIVVTDDKKWYDGVPENVYILENKMLDSPFQYGKKYKALELARHIKYGYKYIMYLDADCFFTEKMSLEDIKDIGVGVNARINLSTSSPSNTLIRDKRDTLTRDGELDHIKTFRECLFLIHVSDNYQFNKFIMEWAEIHNEILEKDLTHVAECIDISLAAFRAGIPMIDTFSDSVRKNVYTTVLGNPIRAIL